MWYLDTSAAVKLVVAERGTTALRRWVETRGRSIFSSDLLRTELLRATRRLDPERMAAARSLVESIILVTLSTAVCERAAYLGPEVLRSLDALHLSAALEMGDDLEGLVTYDRVLADGARSLGLALVSPA